MFGWIPILGPIIDGIVSVFNKKMDKDITSIQTDGTVTVENTKAAASIIESTKDDIGTRLARDILIFPWAIYGGLTGWDYTVALHWPHLVFTTKSIPDSSSLAYLPYMVFVYLLGASGLNIWRRK